MISAAKKNKAVWKDERAGRAGMEEGDNILLGTQAFLREGMATHSSIPAWKIPWTEEPGGLQSTGSQRVRHN